MRRLRDHGLSLAFTALLLGALVGQAFTGQADYNEQALGAGLPPMSLSQYVTSSQFAVDVAENWQSEYLQFLLYILLTVWLVQKGSPESKPLDKIGRESDEDQKVGVHALDDSPAWAKATGWRRSLFSRSLGLTMGLIFLLSWLAQFIAGRSAYNADQIQDLEAPLELGRVPHGAGLLEPDLPELAVGVPCRRQHGACSASTCVSAAHPSRNPSGSRIRRQVSRASAGRRAQPRRCSRRVSWVSYIRMATTTPERGEDGNRPDRGAHAERVGDDPGQERSDGEAAVAPEAVDPDRARPPRRMGDVADGGEQRGVDHRCASAEERGAERPQAEGVGDGDHGDARRPGVTSRRR